MRPEPSFARSIVAWGNACLREDIPRDAFESWIAEVKFIRTLHFRNADHDSTGPAWLWSLVDAGVSALRLDVSDGPGFELVVACDGRAPVSAWRQRWERIVEAKAAPWFDAVFSKETTPRKPPKEGPSVDAVLGALVAALEGLIRLSERADLEQWGPYFASVLDVAKGRRVDRDQTLPPTASEAAHRLARAANQADVFGGMGSWNDFAPLANPDAENERSRWSEAVYEAVESALLATAHA